LEQKLYKLGKHRLLYGDATKEASYKILFDKEQRIELLLTDPPYNVNYSGARTKRKKILNDNLKQRYSQFVFEFLQHSYKHMREGGAYYIFCGGKEISTYMMILKELDFYQSINLVWAKNHFVLSFADYKLKHEPILYGWKKGRAHRYYGAKNQTSVLEYPKNIRNSYHPTQKPGQLIRKLMLNSSQPGDLIFDPFLGSGTTLLEAQANNRVCYGIELDRDNIKTIVNRFKYAYPDEDMSEEVIRC